MVILKKSKVLCDVPLALMLGLSLGVCLGVCLGGCQSPGPVDEYESKGRNTGGAEERLTPDDLVYGYPGDPLPDAEKDFATAILDVAARSNPDRKGRQLFLIRRGEKLVQHKPSLDGKWISIESLSLRKKGWVPVGALKMAAPKVDPAAAPPQ